MDVGNSEPGVWDERIGAWVVKRTENWIVAVAPMIFNDRILLTHVDEYPRTWTAAWCYDKGGAAFIAAHVFDPDTSNEPAGFKKLAGDTRQ